MGFLSPYSERIFALTRIVFGLMFFAHGIQKFGVIPGFDPSQLNAMTTTAGIIEIVAGAMIIVGFYGRYAAFISSGMMAVAYFMVHVGFMGGNPFLPLTNGGEAAVLNAWFFLFLAAHGSGVWSVDAAQGRT